MHEYVIETERLILRPLCDKDRDAIFKWVNDEDVAKYMAYNTYTCLSVMRFPGKSSTRMIFRLPSRIRGPIFVLQHIKYRSIL